MIRRLSISLLPLLIIIALPLLLKKSDSLDAEETDDVLVVVTPHNGAIRYEFERAFKEYWQNKYNRSIDIDWRIPGGTSEIIRYFHSEYTAAFRLHCLQNGQNWNQTRQNAFLNSYLPADEASDEENETRQLFLDSNVGIGIDIFFGGGQFDLNRLAQRGILVPCGVRERHPGLFQGGKPIIPQSIGGEVWYDSEDRYYGTCLSAFGICYNLDRLQEHNLDPEDYPAQWSDLGDPKFFGEIGVADPSKSGSINKCFEMLIQEQMANRVSGASEVTIELLSSGWKEAMLLIRRIGGNAQYFTFSAGKVPVDVADGSVTAGMCIDFYGRSQAEWEENSVGRQTMKYITPEGGSSISADPIGLLRGAPNSEAAREFIDFVLSEAGQKLWNFRVGTPGGPHQHALRRLPVRRDLYDAEERKYMSDPDARPFELAEQFVYHPEWTGRYFGLIRVLIRVMIIDCETELKQAWKAVISCENPDRKAAALALLAELPFSYEEAVDVAGNLNDTQARLQLTRDWITFFREKYLQAAAAAGVE